MRMRSLLASLVLLSVSVRAAELPPGPGNPQRMDWFKAAKFGMFIHWGVYAQAAGEWKGTKNHAEWLQLTAKIPIAEYTELAKQFKTPKLWTS